MPSMALPYHANPLRHFTGLRRLPGAVLLHSALAGHPHSRYDIVSAEPAAAVTYQAGELVVGQHREVTDRPFEALAAAIPAAPFHPHFRYGFIGAFGYGLSAPYAPRLAARNPVEMPDLIGGMYDWSIVTDHVHRTTQLHSRSEDPRRLWQRLAAVIAEQPATGDVIRPAPITPFSTELDETAYAGAFAQVMAHLQAGDCYQVNLARHYQARFEGGDLDTAWRIYQRLAALQPGPFCAYLESAAGAIVSLSPERFLRVADRTLMSMPIKGTRPRGRDAKEDRQLRDALAASSKDRAENLMIVDLVRNDLGRVCEPGSIRTPELFAIDSFTNVHHLVSTITGQRRHDVSSLQCLAAAFPAGSITGAPKHAAMRIIDALEPVARTFYCGAIGYVDAGGMMDTSVAIRTLVVSRGQIHCWGGGGLVADSQLDAERDEIDHKIARLLQGVAES